jgi:hypothetical protein
VHAGDYITKDEAGNFGVLARPIITLEDGSTVPGEPEEYTAA